MRNTLKKIFLKPFELLCKFYRFVTDNPIAIALISLIGAVSTHTAMHLVVLSGASLVVINLLHLLFVFSFFLFVLTRISQLEIFNGKAKLFLAHSSDTPRS